MSNHILLLHFDHDIVVDFETPLVHLVGAQDKLALRFVEKGGTQGVVQGGLLTISDGLDVLQFLGIPDTDLTGKGN